MFDHVGILVKPEAFTLLRYTLANFVNTSETEGFRIEKWGCTCYLYGSVELVVVDENSGLEKYLNGFQKFVKNPDAICALHHIAFRVENLKKAYKNLKYAGMEFTEDHPTPGIGNRNVMFLKPKLGILLEVVELW